MFFWNEYGEIIRQSIWGGGLRVVSYRENREKNCFSENRITARDTEICGLRNALKLRVRILLHAVAAVWSGCSLKWLQWLQSELGQRVRKESKESLKRFQKNSKDSAETEQIARRLAPALFAILYVQVVLMFVGISRHFVTLVTLCDTSQKMQ